MRIAASRPDGGSRGGDRGADRLGWLRERAAADVPAEHGAVPGCQRAAARLRGPLPRAGPPPARRSPTSRCGSSGSSAIREGYEVGEHGVAVAAPGRLRGADDLGRALRGRPLRHRGGRPAAAAARRLDTSGQLPGRRRGDAARAHPKGDRRARTRPRGPARRSRSTAAGCSEMRGDDVLDGDLPRDPEYLSYSLAATCLLTLHGAAGAARGRAPRWSGW